MDVATNTEDTDTNVDVSRASRSRAARVGVVLMVFSLALWVALPVVPFLPLSVAAKATGAGTLIIVAEVAFWGGAVLAGPTAARRMRSWWRRGKTA